MKFQTLRKFLFLTASGIVFGDAAAPSTARAGMVDFPGPAGTSRFGGDVKVLPNGNFVVVDENYMAPGSGVRTGAVFVYKPDGTLISTLTGSHNDDRIGSGGITVLANGNFVIESYRWDNGSVIDAGAVTWGSMTEGVSGVVSPENSLVGSSYNDQIGDSAETRGTGGIVTLSNGNYVVVSPTWDNGFSLQNAGAVTWGNGATGVKGVISPVNSLVGTAANSYVGRNQNGGGVTPVGNSHYVVASPYWKNGGVNAAGAVTWCDGATGRTGPILPENSLVGGTAGDNVGGGPNLIRSVVVLSDGNYVVASPGWDRPGIVDAGAVTWCPGNSGKTGLVTEANSLTGATVSDKIAGYETSFPGAPPVIALKNGNYAVASFRWDKGGVADVGAVTWCAAGGVTTGPVTALNSVTGSTAGDMIGRMVALTTGDYVVAGEMWDNGSIQNAGAARLLSGSGPTAGVLDPSNSLVGTQADDRLSSAGLTALTNGNFVVASPRWKKGTLANVGAVTWVSGMNGLTGPVTEANSLTGSLSGNLVGGYLNSSSILYGGRVTALTNGNYVVASPSWRDDNDHYGAVTWGDGATGLRGTVSAANSITGTAGAGVVGGGSSDLYPGGVTALANGNYVIGSPGKIDGALRYAGAFTWASGTAPTSLVVSAANSLTGSTKDQYLGAVAPIVFADGGYGLLSPDISNGANASSGALFYSDGIGPVSGTLTAENSILGTEAGGGKFFSLVADPARNRLLAGVPYDNRITFITRQTANAPQLTIEKGDGSAVTAGGTVDAGETAVGGEKVMNLIFRNPGYSDLILTSITSSDPRFIVRIPAGTITLARGESLRVPVSFIPEANGTATAVIRLLSNDPSNPEFNITVSATTVESPASITTDIAGPLGSGRFGREVFYLPNGNLVVTDPWYDPPGPVTDAGAVYLYSPSGAMISRLTGSTAGDFVGDGGITILANGNFVIRSATWHNAAGARTGAATWASGTEGVSGTISATNSLIGSTEGDDVGACYTFFGKPGIFALPNGNYIVLSPVWNKYTGAVTWGNGAAGVSGIVSSANSLTGGLVGDRGLTILRNGNCVVTSNGAVTWISASTGVSGPVSGQNSLLTIGYEGDAVSVAALSDGNYAAAWPGFNESAGAVVWGNGASGSNGNVQLSNALIGAPGDQLGSGGIVPLADGRYAVLSPQWSGQRGAVTWGAAGGGATGIVTAANSLTGSQPGDRVGVSGITLLTNGNCVVASPNWANGQSANAGAITWSSGQAPVTGAVSAENSLIGTLTNDYTGYTGVAALEDGHYVVGSGSWNKGQGAVTWGDGFLGRRGPVSPANSLTGPVGPGFQPGEWMTRITALKSGAYVLSSPFWKNAAGLAVGAVTWMSGPTDGSGTWNPANALTGSSAGDVVGGSVQPLPNGHYVILSPAWSASRGAITWADGFQPLTGGTISSANSLVGTTPGDALGKNVDNISSISFAALEDGHYLVGSPYWSDGAITRTGAITLGDGSKAVTGEVSAANSLIGKTKYDSIGNNGFTTWPGSAWAHKAASYQVMPGEPVRIGTMIPGHSLNSSAARGAVGSRNSVLTEGAASGSQQSVAYDPVAKHWAVGRPNDSIVTIFSYAPLPYPRLALEQPGGLSLSSGSTLDFGWRDIGQPSDRIITLVNTGGGTLNLNQLMVENSGSFTIQTVPGSSVLPAGARTVAVLRFTPQSAGVHRGTLRAPSNDPDNPAFTLNLRGVAWPQASLPFGNENLAPEIAALPDGSTSVSFHAVPGITYRLERSPDLKDWSFACLVTADANGAVIFTDPAPRSGSAFYRLRSR